MVYSLEFSIWHLVSNWSGEYLAASSSPEGPLSGWRGGQKRKTRKMECAGWYIPPPSIFLSLPHPFLLLPFHSRHCARLFPPLLAVSFAFLPHFLPSPPLFSSLFCSLFPFFFSFFFRNVTTRKSSRVSTILEIERKYFGKNRKETIITHLKEGGGPRYWLPAFSPLVFLSFLPSLIPRRGRNCTIRRTNRPSSEWSFLFWIYISGWQSSGGKIETRIDHFALLNEKL